MANSELYNKTYKIPKDVINHILLTLVSNPTGNGVKRAKYIVKNGIITYQSLKRLKNFFDYYDFQNNDKSQYDLAGGNLMKTFVVNTLNSDRNGIARRKKVKQEIISNPNSELKAYDPRV